MRPQKLRGALRPGERGAAGIRRRVLVALLVLLAPIVPAQGDGALPPPVAAMLRRDHLAARDLSLYVQDVDARAPVLAFRADIPRHPASTIKLLTTFAALEELGPAYVWRTEAYTTGPLRHGRLQGDLYLKGYGDPDLVIERFWRLLRALRAQGLRSIAGDLVLDQSYFAPEPGGPGRFDDRPSHPYNVLPQALLVNFQAVRIGFAPKDGRVRVTADPKLPNLDIDNRLRLTRGPCGYWGGGLVMNVTRGAVRDTVRLRGRYPASCGANRLFRVVCGPTTYIAAVFRSLWAELGGRWRGTVRLGVVPADARPLVTWRSPPLAEVIRSINKFSNNVMARQLLLTLGAEKLGPPGTTAKGVAVLHAWLARRGLDFPELTLENGSGLSRREQISARHLGMVLAAAYRSPFMPEFVSSLPIAGLDGTLAHRLRGSPLQGRAHLKTGTLDGARGVAGYVLNRAGRTMIVVYLDNGPQAGVHDAAVERAFLDWVYARP